MKKIIGFVVFINCFVSFSQDLSQTHLNNLKDEELLSLFNKDISHDNLSLMNLSMRYCIVLNQRNIILINSV